MPSSAPSKARHLCVLIHGLWGNANHLNYVADSIRDRFSEDQLVVYSAKKNTGSLTYDGIEIGAERVAREIEDLLEELARDEIRVDKFSIVGYSLGGLVARFVVGLLDHKGYLDRMTAVNFVTFATPHLGVRSPLLGYHNQVWNVLGARTLSQSGRELFMIDDFRQTGRPLLSVLADPDSIFIRALAKFQTRCLYANVVNDRSAVFYTTAISKYDPYVYMDRLRLRYVKDYEPVVLDPEQPFDKLPQQDLPTLYDRLRSKGQTLLRRIPFVIVLGILIPIALVGFLVNSAIQTLRSQRRIRLHEKDEQGPGRGDRIPLFVENMRVGLEGAFEHVNSSQEQDYLPEGSEELVDVAPSSLSLSSPPPSPPLSRRQSTVNLLSSTEKATAATTGERPHDSLPTLALTPAQFAAIKSLDDVGFRKFHVYIHKSSHSHAAIIVRMPRAAFEEGKLVVKHWLEKEFKL
ncbi:hypothetical protein DV735_g2640, partial [Chaetothyriales sp. CBS 134920]